MSRLTERDGFIIARATELAELHGTDAIRERFAGWGDDTAAPYIEAFALARVVIADLIAIIDRLDGENS